MQIAFINRKATYKQTEEKKLNFRQKYNYEAS